MCTVNDEDGELLMIPKQSLSSAGKVCRSCDNEAKVVLRKKDAYCRRCFLNSSIHKFRATLGKSKMVKAGDKVLVVFTENSSSIALLHFLYSGLNEGNSKRFVFNVGLLFIDDSLVSGASFEKREAVVEEVKSVAKSFNFSILITSLSEVFSEMPHTDTHLNVNKCLEDQTGKIFKSIKSMTAKEDLLYQLRYKLMLKIASSLGYDKIFTSEVGTDLAVKLLVGISLGRGDQISCEVGFCDNRISSTPILRPLKDFTQKEVIYYNVFQKLKPMSMLSLTKIYFNDVSIQNTTQRFVNELQEKFPSTVYTIFRTGDKLKMGENYADNEGRDCILCSKVIRNNSIELCDVIDALDFSRKLSEVGDERDSLCSGGCSCTSQNGSFHGGKMEKYLCYGCFLIWNDMENKDMLWSYLLKKEMYDKHLQNLRSQISEFLID